jgi:hypothetical protein
MKLRCLTHSEKSLKMLNFLGNELECPKRVSELSRMQIRNSSNRLFDMYWNPTEITCTDHT